MSDEPTNGRVTNRELEANIKAVREEMKAQIADVRGENKSEHWKTRLIVAVLNVPNALRAAPALLGYIAYFHGRGWVPW